MHLHGSCHCGSVQFSCDAFAPVPFMRCYCSICRKSAGGGGFAINLGAWSDTLQIEGKQHLAWFHARIVGADGNVTESSARRHFCRECGSALWLHDPGWPELVHPHASAIDTSLPEPPETFHILLHSKADWVAVPDGGSDRHFDGYPDESLEAWHRRHGLLDERER